MKKFKSFLSRQQEIDNPLFDNQNTTSRMRTIINDVIGGINEGFAFYDNNDHLILWNNRFLEIFPTLKTMVTQNPTFHQLETAILDSGQLNIKPENHSRWLERRSKQRKQNHSQTEYQLQDGRWIQIIDRRTSQGNVVSICHDITESKTREEKLRAAKEMAEAASRTKSTFLAHVSHELRTPLNAIIGFSEMMSRQLLGPIGNEQYQAYSDDILQSAQHLLGLIDDILNVSKAEVGHLELNEGKFSMAEVAMQIERMIGQRIQEADLTLEIRLSPHLPLLFADERKIKQILINLLVNAIKFTPEGGHIRLSINKTEQGLSMQVQDTGIGMDKSDIPKALEAFGQVENNMTRKYEGSGLGLYLTSMYVRLHSGKMRLQSKKGKGTTVTITLPVERLVNAAA